jgi:DNA polymerase III alpha subunit
VFQLEKSLGKKWTKEIKPRNIEQLADVISLIRPGCLEAEFREDPKTQKKLTIIEAYVETKRGNIQPEYVDKSLEPIFKDTFGVPIYQEQIMRICTDFAGFSLKEADDARKAMGKKNAEKMKEVGAKFAAGAKKLGHDEAIALQIFSWIDKFSGYGFNKSHAVSYAMTGYMTAYAKVHFSIEFFKAMLTNSQGKQDSLKEIKELVNEAKLFNISVRPPNLSLCNEDFAIQDEKTIAFGLGHVKGIGASSIKALEKISHVATPRDFLVAAYPKKIVGEKLTEKQKQLIENNETIEEMTGNEINNLIVAEVKEKKKGKLNKTVCEALIKSGALDHLSKNRLKLLECYRILGELTVKELECFVGEYYLAGTKFDDAMDNFVRNSKETKFPNKARQPKIIEAIALIRKACAGTSKFLNISWEKFYLGVPLSGSIVELHANSKADTKLRNFLRLKEGTPVNVAVVIEEVKKFKDKNGNWMAFLTVSDETYMFESVVVFSKAFNENGWIIEEGKPVLLSGRKNKDSLVAWKIDHL